MAAVLVIYDLPKLGQNYKCIKEKIEQHYPTHWRFQQSAWVIETRDSEEDVCNRLSACLDDNDKLFATRIAETSAWIGYDDQGTQWLASVI